MNEYGAFCEIITRKCRSARRKISPSVTFLTINSTRNALEIRAEGPLSEDGDKLPELWHDHARFF